MTSTLASLANTRNLMWFNIPERFVYLKVVLGMPSLITLLVELLSRMRGGTLRNEWEIRVDFKVDVPGVFL